MTENELLREAARILARLSNDAGYIAKLGEEHEQTGPAYGLFTRRNQYRRPVLTMNGETVTGMAQRGWVIEREARFVLGDDGELWLRRCRSATEPFREQHQLREMGYREIGGARRPVLVNGGESPLSWLRKRKDRTGTPLIDADQFDAGERLRVEYERAQLMPSITSNWDSAAPGRRMRRAAPEGAGALSDSALAARQRVARTLEAVGPELAGVLIDICCHLVGLSEVEKTRGWPQRSGKVILQIALTRLVRHYGQVGGGKKASSPHTRISHWGADGFRPTLEQWK